MNFNLNVVSIRRFKEKEKTLTPTPQFAGIDNGLQNFFYAWTKSAVAGEEVSE